MDNLDRRIIAILRQNPDISLSKIGQKLGISHVAVRKRLLKLKSSGLLRMMPTLNIEKLGYKIALIMAEVGGPKQLHELFTIFKDCPRMIFLSTCIGQYNVVSMMYAEDSNTLESVIGFCSFRTHDIIRKSEVLILGVNEIPQYLPIRICPDEEKQLTIAPCGANCSICKRYNNNKCRGCPLTVYYRELKSSFKTIRG